MFYCLMNCLAPSQFSWHRIVVLDIIGEEHDSQRPHLLALTKSWKIQQNFGTQKFWSDQACYRNFLPEIQITIHDDLIFSFFPKSTSGLLPKRNYLHHNSSTSDKNHYLPRLRAILFLHNILLTWAHPPEFTVISYYFSFNLSWYSFPLLIQ